MNKKNIALFTLFPLLLVTCFIGNKEVKAPIVEKPYDLNVVKTIKDNYNRYEVYNLAMYYADINGVPYHNMLITIDGESDFEQYAKGDGGKSLGACQIHQSNKIPTDKRYDPRFCLDFTAKKIASGQGRMWTAYRTCVLNETVIVNGEKIKCHGTGTL